MASRNQWTAPERPGLTSPEPVLWALQASQASDSVFFLLWRSVVFLLLTVPSAWPVMSPAGREAPVMYVWQLFRNTSSRKIFVYSRLFGVLMAMTRLMVKIAVIVTVIETYECRNTVCVCKPLCESTGLVPLRLCLPLNCSLVEHNVQLNSVEHSSRILEFLF